MTWCFELLGCPGSPLGSREVGGDAHRSRPKTKMEGSGVEGTWRSTGAKEWSSKLLWTLDIGLYGVY